MGVLLLVGEVLITLLVDVLEATVLVLEVLTFVLAGRVFFVATLGLEATFLICYWVLQSYF